MGQSIMLARMAYVQFAAGFGNFDALDAIPIILWFGVPILSSIGMYHPLLGHLSFAGTCLQVYQWRPWSKFSMRTESNH